MDKPYYLNLSLTNELEIPDKGSLSRTLLNNEHTKILLFAFASGDGLTAHSAPFPATIQILKGEATLTLDTESFDVSAGSLVHISPQLLHAVAAKSPVQMLLTLYKAARASK